MNWTKEMFKTGKPIIAMCHLQALPGDPQYDESSGMEYVLSQAYKEMKDLQ